MNFKFFSDLKKFVVETAHDERIPERDKKIILALVVLIVSPIDFIPDWIPVIGLLDDFIILALVLDYFFEVLDNNILLSHYPWGMKSFTRLKRISSFASLFIPDFVKAKLWQFTKDPFR